MTNARPDLNSKEVLDLVKAAGAGDAKAFSQLVVLLTPVVRAQTKRIFVNGKLEGDDLFQEGMFGVMEAVRKFDASRGASFLTYANLCIRSKLLSAPEEIAYRFHWIDKEQLKESAEKYGKSPYGEHLRAVLEDRIVV